MGADIDNADDDDADDDDDEADEERAASEAVKASAAARSLREYMSATRFRFWDKGRVKPKCGGRIKIRKGAVERGQERAFPHCCGSDNKTLSRILSTWIFVLGCSKSQSILMFWAIGGGYNRLASDGTAPNLIHV